MRRPAALTGLFLLAALVTAAPAAAQFEYVPTPVPGPQPPNEPGFGEMATTKAGDEVVLFGAGGQGGAGGNETWVFDADAVAWEQRMPTDAPTPRQAHAMAAAPSGAPGQVLLYGGIDDQMQIDSATWRWTGSNWVLVCGACTPGPLARAMMASNGTETLLFGGSDATGFDNKLYRFDPGANDWDDISPMGATPVPSGDAQFAWDGTSFVLFGGLDNTFHSRSDTWRLVPDGNGGYTWDSVCDDCEPTDRILAGFAPCGNHVVLVGGQRINPNDPQPILYLSDVWRWHQGAWVEVEAGLPPTSDVNVAGVPYFPLLATLPNGALLVANEFDPAVDEQVTRSYVVSCRVPTPPVPPNPPVPPGPAAVPVEPTFTG